jgi:glycosyltransferase involved in cell wall biosynthesis
VGYEVFQILSPSVLRYINLLYFFSLRSIIRQKQVKHVIIEHPYYGWLGILLQQLCSVKLIVHSHNIETMRFKELGKWWWPLLEIYEKLVHKMADHSFCITPEDRDYLIEKYDVEAVRTSIITYGITVAEQPSFAERASAKDEFIKANYIPAGTVLYLFNGAFNYKPNEEALQVILNRINPTLSTVKKDYRIIICGKDLPSTFNELKTYSDKNIIYMGFVPNITMLLKACDVFINPILSGGGIKTKLVEALGYGMAAVSTIKGATGVDVNICNGKLLIHKNKDWLSFADLMVTASSIKGLVGASFYEQFYWGNIGAKAGSVISAMDA